MASMHQQHCNEIILTYLLFATYPRFFRDQTEVFFFNLYCDMSSERSDTLKGYFKRVMVNILVDIERGVNVQNIRVVDLPVDWRIRWELRKQMGPANDSVEMDDTHVARSCAGRFGLHDPQTGVGIRFVARGIPTYERTRVVDTVMRKFEEKINSRHEECSHPYALRVSHTNKNTVPTWSGDVTSWPEGCGPDDLSIHTSRAGGITWCAERRCC
jgi:hypothetical protein